MLIPSSLATLLGALLPLGIPQVDAPVEPLGASADSGELDLRLRPQGVTRLFTNERVLLRGLSLADGALVDLSLERIDLRRGAIGLRVDDHDAIGFDAALELSVWIGRVADRSGESEAALAFSQAGVFGWVRLGGRLDHFATRGHGRLSVSSETLRPGRGGAPALTCAATALPSPAPIAMPPAATSGRIGPKPPRIVRYRCRIAVETDWQLYQVFGGDLAAEVTYVTSLLTWVGYRFEEQIGVSLEYPYLQLHTQSNDPWHSQDIGGNCIDLVYELQAAWTGNIPAGADLAHFLSGANLGCGAAFIGGLCDPTRNFGVTGNIDGQNQFPIQVGPSNFNFYGVTHELGHNFDAIHTHDYCPPIDQCAPPGYFGPCQTQRVCTTQGTLMSYCHGCPGGFQNITTYFHPRSVEDMRGWVETAGCLPIW